MQLPFTQCEEMMCRTPFNSFYLIKLTSAYELLHLPNNFNAMQGPTHTLVLPNHFYLSSA